MRAVILLLILLISGYAFSSHAEEINEEEPNDSLVSAMEISLGDKIIANISPENEDWYVFYLTQFTNISITIESEGNVKLEIDFEAFAPTVFETHGTPLTKWYYLPPEDFGHRILIFSDQTVNYNLTLSEGNPIVDDMNHDRQNAVLLELETVYQRVLNISGEHTGNYVEDWYNFTITLPEYYRITSIMQGHYELVGMQLFNETHQLQNSHHFGFNESFVTIVNHLNTGNHSLKLYASRDTEFPIPYMLSISTNIDMTPSGNVKDQRAPPAPYVEEHHLKFASISPGKPDYYNFTVDTARTMIISKPVPETTIELQTPFETIEIDEKVSISMYPGDYSMKLSTEVGYYDFWIEYVIINQDEFDRDNLGHKNAPVELEFGEQTPTLSIHSSADEDYFYVFAESYGLLSYELTNNQVKATWYDSDGFEIDSEAIHYVGEGTGLFVIKIDSDFEGILYQLTINFTPDTQSTVTTRSQLKIPAFLFSQIVPVLGIVQTIMLRKKSNT